MCACVCADVCVPKSSGNRWCTPLHELHRMCFCCVCMQACVCCCVHASRILAVCVPAVWVRVFCCVGACVLLCGGMCSAVFVHASMCELVPPALGFTPSGAQRGGSWWQWQAPLVAAGAQSPVLAAPVPHEAMRGPTQIPAGLQFLTFHIQLRAWDSAAGSELEIN